MLLETKNLKKYFGDVRAVDGVNLKIEEGTTTSIVGPNGAGKTTLYNLVTGEMAPDSGKIIFQGEDITNSEPHETAQWGIVRAYQISNFFPNLRVEENFQVAAIVKNNMGLNMFRARNDYEDVNKLVSDFLKRSDLEEWKKQKSENLPHGLRKRLEVMMAMLLDPTLAILDEPTAGLTPEESKEMSQLIHQFAKECTILITEHDLDIVFDVAERIIVMHQGEIIAEGEPEEIKKEKKVREVYLGGSV